MTVVRLPLRPPKRGPGMTFDEKMQMIREANATLATFSGSQPNTRERADALQELRDMLMDVYRGALKPGEGVSPNDDAEK